MTSPRIVRVLVLSADAGDLDAAADALWRRGVTAIEERTSGAQTQLRVVLGDDELPGALADLGERFDVHVEEVDARPGEQWREHAEPVRISDRLVVGPVWRRSEVDEEGANGTAIVWIEPGAAFGLGDHPTTRATLTLLERRLDRRSGGCSVVDVGSGTGVLGIAALLLGATAVRAVDVSSAAVQSTLDNAERNGVADRLVADRCEVGDLDGSYDVVVANLLAPILIEHADELRRLVAPGGALIMSGVLEGREAHVLDALSPLSVVERQLCHGWVAIELR